MMLNGTIVLIAIFFLLKYTDKFPDGKVQQKASDAFAEGTPQELSLQKLL